jgi:hypothetical protein
MEQGIFFQRAMNSRFIVIARVGLQRTTQMCLAQHDDMVDALATIDPISLSAKPSCHGAPGATGLSRMPRARNRRITAAK